MPRISAKVSPIIKIYIWFYRFINITFGGITINSNQKLSINKYLKYYGYFAAITITLLNIFIIASIIVSKTMVSLYNLGSIMPYFMSITTQVLQVFQVLANLWFLNRNGIKFFEIFYNYEIDFNKNQIILIIIWICHILLAIGIGFYNFFSKNYGLYIDSSGFVLFLALFVFRTCTFLAIWAVSFLTWIISIHFYEFLTNIKDNLKLQINRNSGNFFFKRAE
jgi:hypothetical protein